MRLRIAIICAVLATVILGSSVIPTEPSAAASGEEVIKARIDFMNKDIYRHWEVLAAYAKNNKGSLSDVEENAVALRKLAEKITSYFPKDTGRGNYPAKQTRTLPVVWSDWDGFREAVKELSEQSEKLARFAKEGNKDAVVELIGKSGKYSKTKIGCADCHDKFRGPKAK